MEGGKETGYLDGPAGGQGKVGLNFWRRWVGGWTHTCLGEGVVVWWEGRCWHRSWPLLFRGTHTLGITVMVAIFTEHFLYVKL